MQHQNLLTKEEVASKFRVSTQTINRWMKDNRIPSTSYRKIGQRVLFDPSLLGLPELPIINNITQTQPAA